MKHKTGCLICGKELVYPEKGEKLACYYCGETRDANAKCVSGHYVCDKCHSMPAADLIERYCVNSRSEDPLEIALALMKHPEIKMHGPEHHFLIPAVLLASYYNVKKEYGEKAAKIKKARERSEKILGGFCGFYGDCGAAVGTGIFVSLITGATPLSKEEWKLSNLMTSRSLLAIANNGGPRCCKRNTYLAIAEAIKFLEENFDVKMKLNEKIICGFSSFNKECKTAGCLFYEKKI